MRSERQFFSWEGAGRASVLGCVLLSLLACVAQEFPIGLFREFSVPEYYKPPHETQIKSLLQGEEAMPQDEDKILIKNLTLKTFREDGVGEFVMRAKDCLYDGKRHTAASEGPLEMMTVDGRFSTEGEGFLWQERSSVLTISNRVHTVIRQDRPGAPKS